MDRKIPYSTPDSPDNQIKVCTACKTAKPFDQFWKQTTSKDGKMAYCKICTARKVKEWRENNHSQAKAYQRAYYARKKAEEGLEVEPYGPRPDISGVDSGQYEALLKRQHHKCAICKATTPRKHGLKRFIGDYSPLDGSLRGLLCAPCDIIMDMAGEDAKLLRRASSYLQRAEHSAQP